MRSKLICCFSFVTLTFVNAQALAGPGEDKAAADALFKAGRALVKQGNFAEACPKLEASHKLDPAIGTLLALGDCYESNGQTASAWTTFNDVRAMARKANDTKRADEAERRAGLLEPKLSKILIEVPQDTRGSGVEVRRNGKLVEPAMFGLEVAVDPGKQTIDATAPGQQVWSTEVMIEPKPSVTTIRIPSLVELKPAVVEYKPPKPPPPTEAPTPPPDKPSGFGTQRTIGVIVAGVGVAGVIVGSVFGAKALSAGDNARASCKESALGAWVCPNAASAELYNDGKTAANISNVGIGVGAAAIVAGVVVIAIAPKNAPSKTSSTWHVAPVIAPGWATLSVTGAF